MHTVVLLLLLISIHEGVILDKSLLEEISESEALVSIRLHLTVILIVFAHFNVLFELLDLPILHLILQFHFSVLAL